MQEGTQQVKALVAEYPPEKTSEITGVPVEQLYQAAEIMGANHPLAVLYAMGITQHICGTNNVKSLANLAMLCGNVGIEGGGVNPLRGQNNVQGACDMGCLPNVYTGYRRVADLAIRETMAKAWGVESLPAKDGLVVTHMMNEAHEGRLKAMFIVGENPMVSDPDLKHARKSLERLDFLVVQDIFMTETAQMAHVVPGSPDCCHIVSSWIPKPPRGSTIAPASLSAPAAGPTAAITSSSR